MASSPPNTSHCSAPALHSCDMLATAFVHLVYCLRETHVDSPEYLCHSEGVNIVIPQQRMQTGPIVFSERPVRSKSDGEVFAVLSLTQCGKMTK